MCISDNTTPNAETPSEVCSAAEALKRAKEELEKAQAFYENVRQQAAERIHSVRKANVGELLDGSLELVRRYPGAGVAVAALAGFFLGKMFRR
jgi:ElaB/YqjD/DUF883 family membrane-anchored ribosome-binding protein